MIASLSSPLAVSAVSSSSWRGYSSFRLWPDVPPPPPLTLGSFKAHIFPSKHSGSQGNFGHPVVFPFHAFVTLSPPRSGEGIELLSYRRDWIDRSPLSETPRYFFRKLPLRRTPFSADSVLSSFLKTSLLTIPFLSTASLPRRPNRRVAAGPCERV